MSKKPASCPSPDITDAPTPMATSVVVPKGQGQGQASCEVEDNKVRRSSRIKSLESQRGGRRRREVVFASALSRSLPNLHDDDSSSNSPTESHLSGGASPIRDGAVYPFGSSSTPNLLLGVADSKPLKVKSRWRYSSDAESLRSTDSASDLASNSSASMFGSCGSLDEDEGSSSGLRQDVFMRSPSLIRKPGHLMFEPGDTELNDKLKKFQGIEESIFRTERKISKESRGMVCDCFLTVEDIERGDEGCNDDCLNRLLMVECGPRCPTGENCTNKRFQKKEYMTLEVFKTEKKGHGLRTLEFVPEGGFVIEYVGEVLDPWQFEKRTNEYAKGNQEHFYFMALKSDAIIDATVKGNCSRFINHSCEPNCETQKWTVNGELRIGFFTLRDLRPGEEIVFDYQFQRYGKKAQRCFCMTPSCRGWIGEEEEDEDKEELQGQDVEVDAGLPEPEEFNIDEPEKVKKKVRAPRKKRKDTRILEDVALEEELGQLERTGLKNRHQTLTLSRLMVRAEKWDDRVRLLNILREGDSPCRRLFLDYRGLKLIHNWMVNLPLPSNECKEQLIKDEEYHQLFLNVLQSLPVPNMTLLLDSKILNLIETWAEAPAKIEAVIKKESPIELEGDSDKAATNPLTEKSEEVKEELMETTDVSEEIKSEKPNITKSDEDMLVDSTNLSLNLKEIDNKPDEIVEISWKFVDVAKSLLLSWADLKEVFRIPKRERVEQMKEHEREADKGLTISMDSDSFSSLSYGSDGRSKWTRTGRERRIGILDPYGTNRPSNRMLMYPNLSKEERRSIFALKVAQEEEHKKQQKMQEEIVTLHSNRCGLLGLDPSTTPIVDISGHYFLDPKSIEWKIINVDDPTLPPELRLLVKAALYPEMGPATTEMETNSEPEFVFPPWPEGLPPPPPLPPAALPDGWKMAIDDEGRCYYYHVKTRQSQWHPPVLEDGGFISMESSGTSESEEDVAVAVTDENIPPVVPKPHIQTLRTKLLDRAERRKKSGLVQVKIISPRTEEDKSSFSKSTIRERKLEVLEEKMKKVAKSKAKAEEVKKAEAMKQLESIKKSEASPVSVSTSQEESVEEKDSEKIATPPVVKKFKPDEDISDDLDNNDVIESVELEESPTISSPIETELDISLAGTEDDSLFEAESSGTLNKSENSIPGLDLDPRDLPYQSGISLSSSIVIISKKDRSKSERKQKSLAYKKLASDKCKEAFRNQIANVVVTHLNPYRKPDCKSGKIVSTEDFKHLARKMTHAILLKELKHSREGKNLEVTDSVKHKTKEYIKKFMGRFGSSNYIPSPEDSQGKSNSKRSS